MDALDIAFLVQQLQEERAAVALNNFLLDDESKNNIDTIRNITSKTDIKADDIEKALNLTTRFAATDAALAGVENWPLKSNIMSHNWPGDFLKSKLSFQIRHGVFRSTLKTGEKSIFEILKW